MVNDSEYIAHQIKLMAEVQKVNESDNPMECFNFLGRRIREIVRETYNTMPAKFMDAMLTEEDLLNIATAHPAYTLDVSFHDGDNVVELALVPESGSNAPEIARYLAVSWEVRADASYENTPEYDELAVKHSPTDPTAVPEPIWPSSAASAVWDTPVGGEALAQVIAATQDATTMIDVLHTGASEADALAVVQDEVPSLLAKNVEPCHCTDDGFNGEEHFHIPATGFYAVGPSFPGFPNA